jgi:hypothetical protein
MPIPVPTSTDNAAGNKLSDSNSETKMVAIFLMVVFPQFPSFVANIGRGNRAG